MTAAILGLVACCFLVCAAYVIVTWVRVHYHERHRRYFMQQRDPILKELAALRAKVVEMETQRVWGRQ